MEVLEILDKLNSIEKKVDDLQTIEIEVTNGKTKHVSYKRSEFFQMIYDRKNTWKDSFRSKLKDYSLLVTAISGTIFFIMQIIGN